jgi:alpha-methylacyl-CoA racemase
VVDAAIVDGTVSLMSAVHQLSAMGMWPGGRGENLLDGGAPFYGVYACADGGYVSIGPLEPEFRALLLEKLGLTGDPDFSQPYDRARWPAMREKLETVFASKSRDDWTAALEGTDVCFAPVLDHAEAAGHPHMRARGAFTEIDGVRQSAPAPRFSRTPGGVQGPAPRPGEHTDEVLAGWGFASDAITALRRSGALGKTG